MKYNMDQQYNDELFLIRQDFNSVERIDLSIKENFITLANFSFKFSDGDIIRRFSNSGFTDTYVVRKKRTDENHYNAVVYKIPEHIHIYKN